MSIRDNSRDVQQATSWF